MPLPFTLAGAYLVINLGITVWVAREEDRARVVPPWFVAVSRTLRWGPPLLGAIYLVARAGDWPFVLFVAAFFLGAFWLLDGLLNYPSGRPKR